MNEVGIAGHKPIFGTSAAGLRPMARPTARGPASGGTTALPEKKADALMWALALTVLAHAWRIHNIFPVLAKIKFLWLSTLIALIFFLANRDPLRRVALIQNERISRILLLLLGIMAAGVPFAIVRGEAAYGLLQIALPNLLLFTMLACSIRSTRDLEFYAIASLCGASLFALMKVRQVTGIGYYDRNDLALMLVCHVPFAIYLLRPGVASARRLFGLVSLGLMIFVIIAGSSRGGFIGLMAIALYVLLRYRGIPVRTRLFAIVGGFMMMSLVANESYWLRMSTLLNPKADYNWAGNSSTGRMDVWARGIGYMIRNPVLGVGLRNFASAEGHSELAISRFERGAGFKWSIAHSSFVEVGAELGVIGFVSFIALFLISMRSMARVKGVRSPPGTGPPRELPQSQMLLGSLIGFVICGIFISAEHYAMLYVLLGMVVGLLKLLSLTGQRVVPGSAPPLSQRPVSAGKALHRRAS